MHGIIHARKDLPGLLSALLLWLISFSAAAATNDFQNLGFESASLIPIAGDGYNRVEASVALPGWMVYVETNRIDRVLHNNLFSSASISTFYGYPCVSNLSSRFYRAVKLNP